MQPTLTPLISLGWLYPNPKDNGLNKLKDVLTDNANTELTPSLPNYF